MFTALRSNEMATPFLKDEPWTFADVFCMPLPNHWRYIYIYFVVERLRSIFMILHLPGDNNIYIYIWIYPSKQEKKRKNRQGFIERTRYLVCVKLQGPSLKNRVDIGLLRKLAVICMLQPAWKCSQPVWTAPGWFRRGSIVTATPPCLWYNDYCLSVWLLEAWRVRGWPFGRQILDEKRNVTRGGAPQRIDWCYGWGGLGLGRRGR